MTDSQAEPTGDFVADDRGPIVTTYPTGTKLHPYAATPDEIHLEDIAHHLSLVCRFGGGCREFYSVAQHSVLVMRLCTELAALYPIEITNTSIPLALMHDADEYIFGDMTAPVKSRLRDYKAAASDFQLRIFAKFRIDASPTNWAIVKKADRIMRRVESDFLGKPRIEADDRDAPPIPKLAYRLITEAWSPSRASLTFLREAARWWNIKTGKIGAKLLESS